MKGLEIIVAGRVQGVGFRYFTARKAQEYGICGSVKNTLDGKVKIIAYGEKEQMTLFLSAIKCGPSFAFVTEVAITEIEHLSLPLAFKIEQSF
jgi:acylphosphatase